MSIEAELHVSNIVKEFKAMCPFWLKVCHIPDVGKTLVICGAPSPDALPYSEFPDAPPCLEKCPWHEVQMAYQYPVIMEVPDYDFTGYESSCDICKTATSPGWEGIGELNKSWDAEVAAFKQKYK